MIFRQFIKRPSLPEPRAKAFSRPVTIFLIMSGIAEKKFENCPFVAELWTS
jgi:hypothetical protein